MLRLLIDLSYLSIKEMFVDIKIFSCELKAPEKFIFIVEKTV